MKHTIHIHSPTFATNTALDMKLILVLSIIGYGCADKLDKGYLPPVNAASAGGSPGALTVPGVQSEVFGQGLPDSGQPGSSSFGPGTSQNGTPGKAQNAVDSASFNGNFNPSVTAYSPVTPNSNAFGSFEGIASSTIQPFLANEFSAGNQNLPSESQTPLGSYNQEFGQEVQGVPDFNQQRPQAAADRNAETLKYNNENKIESYVYNYETSNGISAEESGVAANGVMAQGGYAYTGDDGKAYSVTYTADKNGYQPQGDHLPTPHPIPEEILKSIEENAKAAAAGTQEGAYIPEEYDSGAYDNTKPGQSSQGSFDAFENNGYQGINEGKPEYGYRQPSAGQQLPASSAVQPSQTQNEENIQGINQIYRPSPYQSSGFNGAQEPSNVDQASNESPIQVNSDQISKDGYQYNQPKPAFQPTVSGQISLDQYRPQVSSQNEKISSPSNPSFSGSVINGNKNFKPSFGNSPSADQSQQYSAGQQTIPGFNPSAFSGPSASKNNAGSFPNRSQQNQIKLSQNNGNGYQYNQPKPVFQPTVSGQISLDQYRPQVSSQGEKISSPSNPSFSGSVFNGNQNFKPSFGNHPSTDQSQQYPSGQQTVTDFKPSALSGPSESQNKEGFLGNQGQQNQFKGTSSQNNLNPSFGNFPSADQTQQYPSGQQNILVNGPLAQSRPTASQNKEGSFPNLGVQNQNKGSSGQLNQKTEKGYQYNKPNPAFQPTVSGQSSLNQYRPPVSNQGDKISSPSSTNPFSSAINGNKNFKPSFGNSPSADQSQQYPSDQQTVLSFKPSALSGPSESKNNAGSFPNQSQQNQIKITQNEGNGYQYKKPKPSFEPTVFKQSTLDNRPQVSSQGEKIQSSSSPSSSGSLFNGNQNIKPSFGNGSPTEQSQETVPGSNTLAQSELNGSQNKVGSFPNKGIQNQLGQAFGSQQGQNPSEHGYQYQSQKNSGLNKPSFVSAPSSQSPQYLGSSNKPSLNSVDKQSHSPFFGSFEPQSQSTGKPFGSFENNNPNSQFSSPNKNSGSVSNTADNSPQFNFDRTPNKVSQYPKIENQPSFNNRQPGQGSQLSSDSQVFGANNKAQGSVSGLKPVQAPYQYNKPSQTVSTQRPDLTQLSSRRPSFGSLGNSNQNSQLSANKGGLPGNYGVNKRPQFNFNQTPSKISQEIGKKQPVQGSQANSQESAFDSRPGQVGYHYNKPSPIFSTQRPNFISQASQPSRVHTDEGNQDNSEKFGGPRQPPSFSPEGGYIY